MLIKKAKYKKVKVTQRQRISDEVYGCDECRTEMKSFPNEAQRLEVKIFLKKDEPTESLHFCSWHCVLKHLPKIKSDYFIDLPFLYYDEGKQKRSASELISIIKRLKL